MEARKFGYADDNTLGTKHNDMQILEGTLTRDLGTLHDHYKNSHPGKTEVCCFWKPVQNLQSYSTFCRTRSHRHISTLNICAKRVPKQSSAWETHFGSVQHLNLLFHIELILFNSRRWPGLSQECASYCSKHFILCSVNSFLSALFNSNCHFNNINSCKVKLK